MRTEAKLAIDRHELLFRVTKSMFYHSQHAHLLKMLNQFIELTAILVNICSIGTLLAKGGPDFPIIAAAFTILGTLIRQWCRLPETVVKDEEKAQLLRQLQEEMRKADVYGEEQLLDFWDRASNVEPPRRTLKILHHISHNRAIDAMGLDKRYRFKWWWQRLAAALVHPFIKRNPQEV